MITIVFESHATTVDNEQKIASGHYDVDLSAAGKKQAMALGERRKGETFDAIFTSDLQRAYKTAKIAFGNRFPIFQDARLRECDYGQFEHRPSQQIETERIKRIDQPFPGGESYQQRADYMKSFLEELLAKYEGKRILIIGHRATQYGLERWTTGKSLQKIAQAPWQWRPGWVYKLEVLKR
ncbi:MAG TPA: histidine phosphatase family protein [Candidatus Saccharimonadales bacterium]|nr:histidine phosphatase family protein [Candidatus Saccharimonadales bacterium]